MIKTIALFAMALAILTSVHPTEAQQAAMARRQNKTRDTGFR